MSSEPIRPATTAPAARSRGLDRLSTRVLQGPLATALAMAYLAMLACWVPQYLSWPWWNDLDHFATFAMAWDRGIRPYRDLPSFQFPGEYYVFWVLGKAFGWGRTCPIYAFDASLLVALGVAMTAWSRRRFGNALPGLTGYGWFLGYYLNLGLHQVAQRDWHAAFFAVLGLFALQGGTGRSVRLASAFCLAAAFSIRPQVVLLGPAYVLALDATARPAGSAWSLSRRAVLEWGAMVAGFALLAFAPLIVGGLLGDFVRGLREAAPGSAYNKLTAESLVTRMIDQARDLPRVTILPAVVALLATVRASRSRRDALTWIAAFAGAWFIKPLSPFAHAYLTHMLVLVASVLAALLVEMLIEAPGRWSSVRLILVGLVLFAGVPTWPQYISPSRSFDVLTREATFDFPRRPPVCGPMYLYYSWADYRGTIVYLRRTVGPQTRVANVLRGLLAVTGPVARLPPFPGESLAWFQYFKDRRDLEDAYIRSLRETPDSVVVWCPGEEYASDSYLPMRLIAYIRSAYEPEARFGRIEVWRRIPAR